MKRWLALASLVAVATSVSIPQASAVPFDAITLHVNVNASGNIVGFTNVIGTIDVTAHTPPPAPANPPDEGSGTASTVGFFGNFVIAPDFISNLGKASVAASTINTAGPTGVGVGTSAHFKLFVEVIPSPLLIALAATTPSLLSDVLVDVGWHVAGSKTMGGNDFAEISVGHLRGDSPQSGRIISFVESAADADLSGVTTVHMNLNPASGLSHQLDVQLRAQCFTTGSSVSPQVSATSCSATADPTFSISPSNPFPDELTLAFSPNLAPETVPVPEPATAWLIVSSVVALAMRGRLKRFTAWLNAQYR